MNHNHDRRKEDDNSSLDKSDKSIVSISYIISENRKKHSSRSNGRVRVGGEKHEIYVVAFSSHLLCDLFLQGRGDGALGLPGSATEKIERHLIEEFSEKTWLPL